MRNLVLVMLGLVMMLIQANAQSKNNVPEKVKTAFAQKFPNAQKAKWEMEDKNEWEAEFKLNSEEYSANFAPDGTWKETETEIEKADIPSEVQKTLDKEFEGCKIEEIELSETPEGIFYEFELEKGKTEMEVIISTHGKLIKKEIEKEHEGDNEEDED